MEVVLETVVRCTEIDVNGHVNNAKYVGYLEYQCTEHPDWTLDLPVIEWLRPLLQHVGLWDRPADGGGAVSSGEPVLL